MSNNMLYDICRELAELDPKDLVDAQRLSLSEKKLVDNGVIGDYPMPFADYFFHIVTMPQDETKYIYKELRQYREAFPANIFCEIIEMYNRSSDIEKKVKYWSEVIMEVLNEHHTDGNNAVSTGEIFRGLADCKLRYYAPVSEDSDMTDEELEGLAQEGDVNAVYLLGKRKDSASSFLKAALRGHAAAMYELGKKFYNGSGVKQSNDKALRWLELARKKGCREEEITEFIELEL